MLRMRSQSPVPEYSEGSWGLSVLLRVPSICTGTTTSPSSSLRQRRDRYTIRAGRNLPDKEFRYLRTVIVTAFVKQSPRLFHCARDRVPGPLLPKLRGQCAEFLNEVSLARLGIRLPFHLCRFWYGRASRNYGAFLGGVEALRGIRANPSSGESDDPCRTFFREPFRSLPGWGMLTPCPSTTPFGLALGSG